MTHDEIQDLLEAYVDDRLDRQTRREVDNHLKTCAECRAILDDVAPVDLHSVATSGFDQVSLRRMARRSVMRTAWSTVVLLIAGFLLMTILSALIYQPLIVNRGGRAADAARASIDVVSMINPGVMVVDGEIQSGLWNRTITLETVFPVGSSHLDLDPVEVRLGASALTGPGGAAPWPYLLDRDDVPDAGDRLSRLGAGTVATVQIQYVEESISLDQAQAIADDTDYDTRVVWAGFTLLESDTESMPIATAGYLGYGTCLGQEIFDDDLLGATSAGFGRSVGNALASITGALHSVVAALENLEGHPDWITNLTFHPGSASDAREAIDRLNSDPKVRTLVITGPSDELALQLEEIAGNDTTAQVLAVDFYNWVPGMCGR